MHRRMHKGSFAFCNISVEISIYIRRKSGFKADINEYTFVEISRPGNMSTDIGLKILNG